MPNSEIVAPWNPKLILPWWPVITAGGSLIFVVAMQYFGLQATTTKLNELQSSVTSVRTETAITLSGIRAETSTIPRLVADQVNLERRLTTLEKINEVQDDRIGRMADSLGLLRVDISDMRGELRAVNGGRVPVPQPGRVPR